MTQPSSPTSPESPPPTLPVPDRFLCQNQECRHPFRFITFDVETSETDFECLACWLAKNLAILQKMSEEGLIDMGAETPS